MKKKSSRSKLNKKILVPLIIAVLLAGAFAGARTIRTARSSAYVLPVEYLNMPYYSDPMSFEGMVYDTESQNVYISPMQIVTEVFVMPGQTVKAGDPILALDITAEEISLQRKEIEVLMAENDLENAQKELSILRNTKPVEKPAEPEDPGTPEIGERAKIGDAWNYLDGSAVNDYLPADPNSPDPHGSLKNPIRYLVTSDAPVFGSFLNAVKKQFYDSYIVIEVREGNLSGGDLTASWTVFAGELKDAENDDYWTVLNQAASFPDPLTGPSSGIYSGGAGPIRRGGDPNGGKGGNGGNGGDEERTYTPEELAEAIRQAEMDVKRCDLALRRARLEYNTQKEQTGDGYVYAKNDGVVTVVGDKNNPPQDGSPFIKIAAGEGVFVQGVVSELSLDKISIGQEITARSWETGQIYTGHITKIDDYPASNYYYYGGANESYYNFLAELDDAADLVMGSYLQLSTESMESRTDSIYLMSAFIRSDSGGKYVMVDEDGRLAKRYIRCGRTYYGEVTEVREGLALEDCITFPYGAGALEGTKTKYTEDQGVFWN